MTRKQRRMTIAAIDFILRMIIVSVFLCGAFALGELAARLCSM